MEIYQHKETGLKYTLEYVIRNNTLRIAYKGMFAYPWKHNGPKLFFHIIPGNPEVAQEIKDKYFILTDNSGNPEV